MATINSIYFQARTVRTNAEMDNVVLKLGELGYVIETNTLKIGDGVKTWEQLPSYVAKSYSFADYEATVAALTIAAQTDYNIGDNVFVVDNNQKDMWITGIVETPVSDATAEGLAAALDADTTYTIGYYTVSWLEDAIDLNNYVPSSRTINGKALTEDIELTAEDVDAIPNTTIVPQTVTTKVGDESKVYQVDENGNITLTLTAADIADLPTEFPDQFSPIISIEVDGEKIDADNDGTVNLNLQERGFVTDQTEGYLQVVNVPIAVDQYFVKGCAITFDMNTWIADKYKVMLDSGYCLYFEKYETTAADGTVGRVAMSIYDPENDSDLLSEIVNLVAYTGQYIYPLNNAIITNVDSLIDNVRGFNYISTVTTKQAQATNGSQLNLTDLDLQFLNGGTSNQIFGKDADNNYTWRDQYPVNLTDFYKGYHILEGTQLYFKDNYTYIEYSIVTDKYTIHVDGTANTDGTMKKIKEIIRGSEATAITTNPYALPEGTVQEMFGTYTDGINTYTLDSSHFNDYFGLNSPTAMAHLSVDDEGNVVWAKHGAEDGCIKTSYYKPVQEGTIIPTNALIHVVVSLYAKTNQLYGWYTSTSTADSPKYGLRASLSDKRIIINNSWYTISDKINTSYTVRYQGNSFMLGNRFSPDGHIQFYIVEEKPLYFNINDSKNYLNKDLELKSTVKQQEQNNIIQDYWRNMPHYLTATDFTTNDNVDVTDAAYGKVVFYGDVNQSVGKATFKATNYKYIECTLTNPEIKHPEIVDFYDYDSKSNLDLDQGAIGFTFQMPTVKPTEWSRIELHRYVDDVDADTHWCLRYTKGNWPDYHLTDDLLADFNNPEVGIKLSCAIIDNYLYTFVNGKQILESSMRQVTPFIGIENCIKVPYSALDITTLYDLKVGTEVPQYVYKWLGRTEKLPVTKQEMDTAIDSAVEEFQELNDSFYKNIDAIPLIVNPGVTIPDVFYIDGNVEDDEQIWFYWIIGNTKKFEFIKEPNKAGFYIDYYSKYTDETYTRRHYVQNKWNKINLEEIFFTSISSSATVSERGGKIVHCYIDCPQVQTETDKKIYIEQLMGVAEPNFFNQPHLLCKNEYGTLSWEPPVNIEYHQYTGSSSGSDSYMWVGYNLSKNIVMSVEGTMEMVGAGWTTEHPLTLKIGASNVFNTGGNFNFHTSYVVYEDMIIDIYFSISTNYTDNMICPSTRAACCRWWDSNDNSFHQEFMTVKNFTIKTVHLLGYPYRT